MENSKQMAQPSSETFEMEGFDVQAGETWIYPTNYPTREYQYNIIQQALLKNTLVSLPTGLGKTFIASVVMYNFYRWYPNGKIIFMAPTKPLVKQQVEACYKITAIPPEVTAELTGAKLASSRSDIWRDKRVFFITPQVLQNDLDKMTELGPTIKCLVFDEAHRAKGNHAYCQVIRKLLCNEHKYFRVLALSATPGNNVNDVAEVVRNLLISHLEFRTEESKDVQQYVFQRSLETVVVQLDKKLIEVRDEYLEILEHYTRTLIKFKIIQGNYGSLTKGKIFMVMKDFQNKNRGVSSSNYSEIMRCLNICVTLYHAYELLIRHGLRSFLSFFDEHIEKPLLRGNIKLKSLLEKVRTYLGPIPAIEVLPDGTYPELMKDLIFGHPKFYKLRDILTCHFSKDNQNTRVIVFFEYRESVMEAHALLLQSRPLIQPKIFLGQGSGVTQKTQIGVIKAFREGKCNTLLSTCIGEEGLDVGEVDLIVCFDISNKSPIRMVQRMGRTGRKRAGSVLVLVTEGKEQQTLKDCLIHKSNISTFVLGSTQLHGGLYPDNPRLVPSGSTPRCENMFITVKENPKSNRNIEKLSRASGGPKIVFTQNNDALEYQDFIPDTKMRSFSESPMARSEDICLFNGRVERMRTAQKTCLIGHSEYTTVLSELLHYADSKRFNIPIKSQGAIIGKPLRQGDIRDMFSRENICNGLTGDVSEVIQKAGNEDSQSDVDDKTAQSSNPTVPTEELCKIVSNYLVADLTNEFQRCPCCNPDFYCEDFSINDREFDLLINNNQCQTLIPSDYVVNDISLENIEDFITFLNGNCYPTRNNSTKCLEREGECDFESRENTFLFEAPATCLKILETLKETDFITQSESQKTVIEETILKFFKLESVCDIYDSSLDSSQDTIIYVAESQRQKTEDSTVPLSVDLNKSCSKNLNDFCDLSDFGLTDFNLLNAEKGQAESDFRNNVLRDDGWDESRMTITQMINQLDEPLSDKQNTSKCDTSEFSVFQDTSQELRHGGFNSSIYKVASVKMDDDDTLDTFLKPFPSSSKGINKNRHTRINSIKSKSKPKLNTFLDTEAEVSQDENEAISEDEDDSFADAYEKSFVNDDTQHFDTQIHAVYLQSIRSPVCRKNFQMRRPVVDRARVYSQPHPNEESKYLEDSFCAKDSDEDDLIQQSQLSVLEILEKQLEEKRKRRKTDLLHSEPIKRRRIKCISSDDSE